MSEYRDLDHSELPALLNKANARIAELEKELKRTKVAWQLAENFIEQLEKELHMIQRHNDQLDHDIYTVCLDCNKKVTGDSIHTCSPQTKPRLSDEEILEAIDNCFGVHAFNMDYEYNLFDVRSNGLLLARAIEERILGK